MSLTLLMIGIGIHSLANGDNSAVDRRRSSPVSSATRDPSPPIC
jgi:hypothetical protein